MEAFTKVVRIGKTPDGNLYCKITYKTKEQGSTENIGKPILSISGVVGPLRSGDCRGGCGQIIMSPWEITEFAPGWDDVLVGMFRAAWEDYHLNDLQAGCFHQRELKTKIECGTICPVCGYSYGAKWLYKEIPTDVIEFLRSLPDTDITPAWV